MKQMSLEDSGLWWNKVLSRLVFMTMVEFNEASREKDEIFE